MASASAPRVSARTRAPSTNEPITVSRVSGAGPKTRACMTAGLWAWGRIRARRSARVRPAADARWSIASVRPCASTGSDSAISGGSWRRSSSCSAPATARAPPHGLGASWPSGHDRALDQRSSNRSEVHDLAPGGDEVGDELLLRVGAGVDLGQRAQLGVRAEHQVGAGAGPLHVAGARSRASNVSALATSASTRCRGPAG